jgi:hypothetical protein
MKPSYLMLVVWAAILALTNIVRAQEIPELEFLFPDPGIFGGSNNEFDALSNSRKTLLSNQTNQPLARIIVVGAMIPDYSISIVKTGEHDFSLVYCTVVNSSVSQKRASAASTLKTIKLPIDETIATGVHVIWATEIKRARYPAFNPYREMDVPPIYYSTFIDGLGAISAISCWPLKSASPAFIMDDIFSNLIDYIKTPEKRQDALLKIQNDISEYKKINESTRQP